MRSDNDLRRFMSCIHGARLFPMSRATKTVWKALGDCTGTEIRRIAALSIVEARRANVRAKSWREMASHAVEMTNQNGSSCLRQPMAGTPLMLCGPGGTVKSVVTSEDIHSFLFSLRGKRKGRAPRTP
jgi:hypothetical protein